MEDNNSKNQNSNNSNNNSSGNKDNSNKKQGQQEESVLTLLQPHDMSKTVESALHVFQGRTEKLPELMQDLGQIIMKASRRFTTTQLVVAAGALTIGAVLLTKYGPIGDDIDLD
ncbi:hypothetical protein DXT99_04760 [Pontibacter diazotrophicus]|uniref:Uncharacterized protein n=1 Tax=Pontibacter diazotrophicus TaxID=1400979 RepID=A0A3D8LGE7_9BACT|nr:hypothetical protein [Pontibacter diazotrophicus]RDV16511.1 hypothetical protein DXT99_04760 [Pontibacter diazotrophicus]